MPGWKLNAVMAVFAALSLIWGIHSYNEKLREEGRIEVLTEQHDSIIEVHEAEQERLLEEMDSLNSKRDTIRQTVTIERTDSLISAITDTVIRVRVQHLVDTLRIWCDLCEQELDAALLLYQNEAAQHLQTQNILDVYRRKMERRVTFGVALGYGAVYDTRDRKMVLGPTVTFGVNIRVF